MMALMGILAYFGIGFFWSYKMLPKWWKLARREWISYDSIRGSVKEQFVWKAVGWVFVLPFSYGGFDKLIDGKDPKVLAEKEEQKREEEKRIARERERELEASKRYTKELEARLLSEDDLDQMIAEAVKKHKEETAA